ncbi:complement factor H-related protein 5 [Erinaceus europaeus]|uniref:Complement factor H-related protein 5 n=1 Tax=Erinaceus europaeus TaxID=9365 RepID=A0ABM3WD29_ERIEU|nr:complement factor H-related protein 5 [Erinaceus europaeus]
MLLLLSVFLTVWALCAHGQERTCDFPQIKHGNIYDEDRYKQSFPVVPGKYFYYSCHHNFVSPSQKPWTQITCTEEGWSPTPTCLRQCFFPWVENGHSASSGQVHLEGATVQITCDTGYRLPNSQSNITCGETGWSASPICSQTCKECKIPQIDRYLMVQPRIEKYKVGSVLKFLCRQRLIRVGPDSVQCYHFGWSPNFPTCKGQVKSCPPPPSLFNGEIKGNQKEAYAHGDMVEYACNQRFLMKGPNKIQCTDGEWTALPVCIEEERTCGGIPELDHGYAKPSSPPYQHGDSVKFSCKEGYTMIGNRSLTCISGMWTQVPNCIATDELEQCTQPLLFVMGPSLSFHHNTNISYKCRRKPESKYSVCINGKWDPEITCREPQTKFCPPPPQIPNAHAMTTTVNYKDGEKISVLCQKNYLIQGSEEIICKNGTWQSIPHCVVSKENCKPPPSIDNGDITSFPLRVYAPGSSVEYQCQNLYKLEGRNTITCYDGEWSKPPKCLDPCVVSEDIMNKHKIMFRWVDRKKHYVQSGYYIEFVCKRGYEQISHQPFRVQCVEGKLTYPTCG